MTDKSHGFFFNEYWELSDIGIELHVYSWYLGHMEETFDKQRIEYIEKTNEAHETGNVDASEYSYYDYTLDMLDAFKRIHRRSAFVSLYSLLEKTLIDECNKQKDKSVQGLLSLNDLAGHSDVDKVKTYFTRVLHMPFPSDTPEWNAIQNYKALRNCIVHAGARLRGMRSQSESKKLRAFIAQSSYLALDQWGDEIEIEPGFCEEAAKTISTFIQEWLYPGQANATSY